LSVLQFCTNSDTSKFVIGDENENLLERTCVYYNCCIDRVKIARDFFQGGGQEGVGVTAAYNR
jgi:hypothetical protein